MPITATGELGSPEAEGAASPGPAGPGPAFQARFPARAGRPSVMKRRMGCGADPTVEVTRATAEVVRATAEVVRADPLAGGVAAHEHARFKAPGRRQRICTPPRGRRADVRAVEMKTGILRWLR